MKKVLLVLMLGMTPVFAGDPPSTHGMLIMGKDKIYLNHLPMFHRPHDYQVLFEAKLSPEAKSTFVDHQDSKDKQKFYTLVPEVFVLPDMVKKPRPFKAEIYAGHFERPGNERIVEETTVEIVRVLFFGKLDPKTVGPKDARYFLFGSGQEHFLAHVISGKPDFDHLLQVNVDNTEILNGLEEAPVVTLEFPGVSNKKPLPKTGGRARLAGGTEETSVKVVDDIYTEFGDLSH